MTGDGRLVGNRWVLVGAIVYLLEWVAIIGTGVAGVGVTVTRGTEPEQVLDSYTGNTDAVAFMAGWFAVVLLGRVLVFIGIRHSLAESWRRHPLLDLAVVAAAVSVVLEIASYAMASASAEHASAGDRSGAVLLDHAGSWFNLMLAGGLGVAITAAAWCMWRSGLFSTALNAIGLVSGVAIVAAQLFVSPRFETLYDILYFFPLVFWVWMIWTGVVLWRRTPTAEGASVTVGR